MPNARQQLERVIARFTDDLVEAIQMVVAEALTEEGAPQPRRAPGRRRGASPTNGRRRRGRRAAAENVDERIVQELDRAGESLAVSDLEARTGLPRSSLTYTLRKLKAAGRIRQEGERRFARYRLSGK